MNSKLLFVVAALGMLAFARCGSPEPVNKTKLEPSVNLTKVGDAEKNQFTVNIKPNSPIAVSFDYVIFINDGSDVGSGTPSGESFINRTMEGIVEVENSEEADIVFDGLNPGIIYTIYARAFDKDGKSGPLATLSVITASEEWQDGDGFIVKPQYVTANSAGIIVEVTQDYYKFDYAFGKPGDKSKFESGTIEGFATRVEAFQYVANYFDLEQATDYTFFARGYDRFGGTTEIFEIPVTTFASGTCPEVTVKSEGNVYLGEYTFTPNSMCGKIDATISEIGMNDAIIDSNLGWQGDIMKMLPNWVSIEMAASATDRPLTMGFITPAMVVDYPIESYVLVYDNDKKPFGIQKIRFTTPQYNDSLEDAVVTATVTDITASGATYEFTVDDNTLGFMYDTVDADWYDELKASGELNGEVYYDNYLRDLFFERGYYWMYANDIYSYTEYGGEPGKRYYVAICPLNGNGVSDPDWGKLYLKEFRTAE